MHDLTLRPEHNIKIVDNFFFLLVWNKFGGKYIGKNNIVDTALFNYEYFR